MVLSTGTTLPLPWCEVMDWI